MSCSAVRIFGVLACGVVGCLRADVDTSFQLEWQPLFPDPHRHESDINQAWVGEGPGAGLQLVEAVPPRGLDASPGLSSPERSFRVFTPCDPRCRLLVRGGASPRLREIQAASFLPGRPFNRLVWLDRTILVFDQAVGPRQGIHYAVDVSAEQLLQAAPFAR